MSAPKTLIQHLKAEYEKKEGGELTEQTSEERAVLHFLRFAESYLAENPSVEIFTNVAGLGLRLKDKSMVCLSSSRVEMPSSMNDKAATDQDGVPKIPGTVPVFNESRTIG